MLMLPASAWPTRVFLWPRQCLMMLVHGYRLLHLFPKVAGAVTKFLEDPVKGRVLEWEPRYLLTPVTYVNEGVFESKTAAKAAEATKKAAEAVKKAEPAKKKDGN